MTGLSVRKSSASDTVPAPGDGELHLWFCHRQLIADSEAFQRGVLARYAGLAPAELRFAKGPHGKPALSFPPLPVAYNVSHSGERMVLVVSGGAAVGVDIEYCDPRRDVEKLARRFFSGAESRQLHACAGPEQLCRFYDYWTLKEAAIKAAGGALGRELETTTFDLAEPAATGEECKPSGIAALSSPVKGSAWFAVLQPCADYRLAICCVAEQDFAGGIQQFAWPHGALDTCQARLLATSGVDHKASGAAQL